MPAGKLIHVVLDDYYGTHEQAKVRHWLVWHPRWTFHFTPTSCSWLNAVETLLAKLTKRRLKRGGFHSLVALQAAINGFVETHNRDPKPFVWKADPNAIIAAAKRGYQALELDPLGSCNNGNECKGSSATNGSEIRSFCSCVLVAAAAIELVGCEPWPPEWPRTPKQEVAAGTGGARGR